jgi:tRNA pseudouridine55 synthase
LIGVTNLKITDATLMNGVLVIDKPAGVTSHDVVARVRRICQERSVGHLGTLDPTATGVLPLLLGKYTRLAQFFADAEKEYEGVIQFGWTTDTYDAEGEKASELRPVDFAPRDLQVAVEGLTGNIQQVPPAYSAKKIAGTPAYKLARKEQFVELKPVKVEVHEFAVSDPDAEGRASFRARVGSGTYVRSLAHDLGQALGCGAHLAGLRRTRSGEFTLAHAVTLEQLETNREGVFVPIRSVLSHIPAVNATDDQLARMRNGNAANLADFSEAPLVKVFAGGDNLICIASRIAGTLFQPKVVLA